MSGKILYSKILHSKIATKKKNEAERFKVFFSNGNDDWLQVAAFRYKLDAQTYAREIHRGKPSSSVKVDDSIS